VRTDRAPRRRGPVGRRVGDRIGRARLVRHRVRVARVARRLRRVRGRPGRLRRLDRRLGRSRRLDRSARVGRPVGVVGARGHGCTSVLLGTLLGAPAAFPSDARHGPARSPVAGPAAGSSGRASYPGAVTSFASDNYSPAHPDVLAALAAASAGHAISYGEDPWTARLQDAVRERFGADATAWPVLTGTGANVVALMAMLPRWGAVVASEHAHLNTDENGAPERVGGVKVLAVPAPDGKIGPDAVERFAGDLGDPHRAQPLVVSLTQSTELGTLYTPAEIREVADAAHAHGMRVHLDGSRLANAAAALDVPLRALTSDAGVDVLSFGGTKNGLALGEAVIVLDPSAVDGVEFVRKATMQLASKMRYVSAQLLALFEPVGDAVAEVDDAAHV